jgi:thioredoxin 1
VKRLFLIPTFAVSLLNSCDHIDAVGDKMDDLKAARKESTQGVEGMDIKAIVNGIGNTGPAIQEIGEVHFHEFVSQRGMLNIVNFVTSSSEPCRKLDPMLEEIIKSKPGVVRLGKLDVEKSREFAHEQSVTKVPDVRFYIDGKLVDKFTGAEAREKIETLVAKHAETVNPADGITAGIDTGFAGITKAGASDQPIPPRPRPANAKPIEEAVKPMTKDWLPPGMKQK